MDRVEGDGEKADIGNSAEMKGRQRVAWRWRQKTEQKERRGGENGVGGGGEVSLMGGERGVREEERR